VCSVCTRQLILRRTTGKGEEFDMKIDYSKWYFTPTSNGQYFSGLLKIFNPAENIELSHYVYGSKGSLDPTDDPLKHIKEVCKLEIRNWYLNREYDKLVDQKIPIEDNLDYVENEAEKRGLI